jgi:Ras family protein T1
MVPIVEARSDQFRSIRVYLYQINQLYPNYRIWGRDITLWRSDRVCSFCHRHHKRLHSFIDLKIMTQRQENDSNTVYITVIGDKDVGKTSLIAAASTETFPDNPPPVLPPANLPANTTPEGVPVVITDTSSRSEDKEALEQACRQASVIVLCFRMETQRLDSLRRVSSYWMPELKRLNVQVPVLLVGCKSDLRSADQSLHKAVLPIVKAYPQIETCMECSAKKLQFVGEVFYYALKAVVYPMNPLYDPESQNLRPLCVRSLKRIFSICDKDKDGVLNDRELNEFQVKCFNAPLQPEELTGVKEVVKSRMENGLSEAGSLTFSGFVFLHALFIERGRLETTWAVLSRFGYGKDLRLKSDIFDAYPVLKSDQSSVQLSEAGQKYFEDVFDAFDADNDGALSNKEQEHLFSSFPENPISKHVSGIIFERTKKGLLTRKGFSSFWNYLAIKSPVDVLASAMYSGLCFDEDQALLSQILETKKPSQPRLTRSSLICTDDVDVSQILAGLVLPNQDASQYQPSGFVLGSIGHVQHTFEDKDGYLLLKSVPLSLVPTMLEASDKTTRLSSLDIAAFVFDWTKPDQFSTLIEAMISIASAAGDKLPCILIGLNRESASQAFVAEVQMMCDTLGISEPVDFDPSHSGSVYEDIIKASMAKEGHIPETPSLIATKRHRRFVARATMYVGIGSLVGLGGYLSYRAYRSYRINHQK